MSDYIVEVQTLEARPALIQKATAPIAELGAQLREILPQCFGCMAAKGLTPTSAPFTRYLGMDGDVLTFEAGLAVSATGGGEGEVVESELPGGPAAVTEHYGPYEQLGAAHEAVKDWAVANGRAPSGDRWEEYVTDPTEEPDVSKWLTRVFLPLQG